LKDQLDYGAWTPLLSSTWFGSSDPVTGRILDGRWENASVPVQNDQFYTDHAIGHDQLWFPDDEDSWTVDGATIHVYNPYGLLRSPWNWNPSPYVTRYNNVHLISSIGTQAISEIERDFYSGVPCDDYKMFLKRWVKGNPFYNFLKYAEDQVHGELHFTFGGAGGTYANEMVRCYCTNSCSLDRFSVIVGLFCWWM
jgi:hypothetical protein